tara:strand:- start:358 stop:579 length:222 start_codon:yes stop_codon:yes gene_type:complete
MLAGTSTEGGDIKGAGGLSVLLPTPNLSNKGFSVSTPKMLVVLSGNVGSISVFSFLYIEGKLKSLRILGPTFF